MDISLRESLRNLFNKHYTNKPGFFLTWDERDAMVGDILEAVFKWLLKQELGKDN